MYRLSEEIGESEARPWGEMEIDVYLIQNWNNDSAIDKEQQYAHLVQQYLNLGPATRQKDFLHKTIKPTQEQITNILEPFRSMKYRALASTLEVGVCLRLDYADDDRSKDFWTTELESNIVKVDETAIIDDKDTFGGFNGKCEPDDQLSNCCKTILRLLPEIITSDDRKDGKEIVLDTMREWQVATDEEKRNDCESAVRNYSTAGTIYIEDFYTHSGEKDELVSYGYDIDSRTCDSKLYKTVLQVMLDGYGNVICSDRTIASESASLVYNWAAVPRAVYMDCGFQDLGVDYAPGGKFAPPYNCVAELESNMKKLTLDK